MVLSASALSDLLVFFTLWIAFFFLIYTLRGAHDFWYVSLVPYHCTLVTCIDTATKSTFVTTIATCIDTVIMTPENLTSFVTPQSFRTQHLRIFCLYWYGNTLNFQLWIFPKTCKPWHLISPVLQNHIQTTLCRSLKGQRKKFETLLLMDFIVWSQIPLLRWIIAIPFWGSIWIMNTLYVLETISIYSTQIHHSSIASNGPGTWNMALWIWTCKIISFVVGTHNIGSLVTYKSWLVNAVFHGSFDQQLWLFMPEDCIIKTYYEFLACVAGCVELKRGNFPQFPVCPLIVI